MVREFGFVAVDAAQASEVQQEQVRAIITERIDLPGFGWRTRR
jgi:hypothetical protein